MEIRTEAEGDRLAVHELNLSAFGRPGEAQLVDALRVQAQPVVSLVAEEGDALVGHILFAPVSLAGSPGLIMGLAPMAVAPSRQRTGIGSALVRAGLQRCGQVGAVAAVVLGHPGFYPRFGLLPGALRGASGTIQYHAAFRNV